MFNVCKGQESDYDHDIPADELDYSHSHNYHASNSKKSTKIHSVYIIIQNSQAVKKVCGPQKGYGEKRCEIQGGGQKMAVMVG